MGDPVLMVTLRLTGLYVFLGLSCCLSCPADKGVIVLNVLFSHPGINFHMRGHNFANYDGEFYWMCHDQDFSRQTRYTSSLLLEVATDFGVYDACPVDGE